MHARTHAHAHTRTHLGAKEPKTRQHKKPKKKKPTQLVTIQKADQFKRYFQDKAGYRDGQTNRN